MLASGGGRIEIRSRSRSAAPASRAAVRGALSLHMVATASRPSGDAPAITKVSGHLHATTDLHCGRCGLAHHQARVP